MARSLALVLAAAAALAPARARACASCSCGDLTLTATGIERPYKNRVRLAVEERYGSLSSGGYVMSNGELTQYGERVSFLRSSLAASWSPIKWLTINALLPWVTSWVQPMRPASTQTINGLGDLELSGRFLVFKERGFAPHHLLWLNAGLKFPTGYRVRDDQGYPFPDDDQPGSGSWDPFAGATYAWFSGGLVSLYASTSYRYTTPGFDGYRRGAVLGTTASVQFQPRPWGAIVLGADGVWQQADRLANGNQMPSTGGVVGYFAPALLASPVRDLLVRLVVDVPVATHLYGTQTVGTQVALSIAYDVH